MPHRYMGPYPTLATGIRIPEIVARPILEVHKDLGTLPTLMLSYHRETGTSDVVSSGDLFRGHTGTSIRDYIGASLELAESLDITVQVEADHVSVSPSPEKAIKRITAGEWEGVSEGEARESLAYISRELEEAREAGGVDVVAIDTTELVDLGRDGGDYSVYEGLDGDERRRLRERYSRAVKASFNGVSYGLKLEEKTIARLYSMYRRSIEYTAKIYGMAREKLGPSFGVEVVLDELPFETSPEELHFFLSELEALGIRVDYVAPNIGFEKREDYRGDLGGLREKLLRLAAVARLHGALLSIHSGSGAHPYSDKGPGVWDVFREALGGRVKYKVSGVYIQLLLEVMHGFPEGSEPRRLYDEIFDSVIESLESQVSTRTGLYSRELEEMIREYRSKGKARDPRSSVFRHYFFLFQSLRDEKGRRYLRERLLEVYERSADLRRSYEREAKKLTARMLHRLGIVDWRSPV
ncbi:MAG: tagaturonate epimerase family protein [Desulfurococcales archaeon]|nr:tagaturonate epimerase family protein [Desulfurococcales archaeon]